MNFCPYCGVQIMNNEVQFCYSCGKELKQRPKTLPKFLPPNEYIEKEHYQSTNEGDKTEKGRNENTRSNYNIGNSENLISSKNNKGTNINHKTDVSSLKNSSEKSPLLSESVKESSKDFDKENILERVQGTNLRNDNDDRNEPVLYNGNDTYWTLKRLQYCLLTSVLMTCIPMVVAFIPWVNVGFDIVSFLILVVGCYPLHKNQGSPEWMEIKHPYCVITCHYLGIFVSVIVLMVSICPYAFYSLELMKGFILICESTWLENGSIWKTFLV